MQPSNYLRSNNVIVFILIGIILTSVVSLVILYSLQVQEYAQLENSLRTRLKEDLLTRSNHISKITSQHLLEIAHTTEIIADDMALLNADKKHFDTLVTSALDSVSAINTFYIFDQNGILLYSTNKNPEVQALIGTSFSDHIAFIGAKDASSTFVSPLTKAINDNSSRIFASVPITDPTTNEFQGVVGASILSEVLATSIRKDIALGNYSVTLADPKGYVIGSSDPGGITIGTHILSEEVLRLVPESIRGSFASSLSDAIQGQSGVYTIDFNELGIDNSDMTADVAMLGYSPVVVDEQVVMISFVVESANIQRLLVESEDTILSTTFIVIYLILVIMALFAAVIIVINRELIKRLATSTVALEENNQELRKITNELINKSAKLEEANRARDEFSAMITHELKTPLVPIIGYAELFLRGRLGDLTPYQQSKIRIIHDSSLSLLRLISDLLDVRKLELGQLRLDLVDDVSAHVVINNAMESIRLLAASKNVALLFDKENGDGKPILVKADQKRLEQVLDNLVTNAIKFVSGDTGVVNVSVRESDGTAIFVVEDNGIGIPSDKFENLFKKFYQVDTSANRIAGGSGLGLAISKGIVNAHGGEIWFESKAGIGSTFYFSIPLSSNGTDTKGGQPRIDLK